MATGSAAGPALAYLVHHGLRQMDTPARLEQGRFVGRPSTIEVRQYSHDGHVWVGGPVTDVASGRFTS